jgi:hypothetical protein
VAQAKANPLGGMLMVVREPSFSHTTIYVFCSYLDTKGLTHQNIIRICIRPLGIDIGFGISFGIYVDIGFGISLGFGVFLLGIQQPLLILVNGIHRLIQLPQEGINFLLLSKEGGGEEMKRIRVECGLGGGGTCLL